MDAWFRQLFPKEESESVYGYDYAAAQRRGYRALLFDTDNTLVPHDAPATTRCSAFIARLKEQGFSIMIVSNNKESRVREFTKEMQIPYIYRAHKPSPAGYLAACRQMGVKPEETLFFGDQIFTDIWGANRAKVRSVLVKPLAPETDLLQIRLKRVLERPILWMYHRSEKRQTGD